MVKEKISGFIDKIRSIDRIAACALVSHDRIVTGKYFDRDLNEPLLGVFLATILSIGESVGSFIRMKSLESISKDVLDIPAMVVGAGENFLKAAIISDGKDPVRNQYQMFAVAKTTGESK